MKVTSISDALRRQVFGLFTIEKNLSKDEFRSRLLELEAAMIDEAWQAIRARHIEIGSDPERSNDPDFVLAYPDEEDAEAWAFVETAPWSRDEIDICPDFRRALYREARGLPERVEVVYPEGLDAIAAAIADLQACSPPNVRDFDPSAESHLAPLAAAIFAEFWEPVDAAQERDEERAAYLATLAAAKAAHASAIAFDDALTKATAAARSYAQHRNKPKRRDGRYTSDQLDASKPWASRVEVDTWRLVVRDECAAFFAYHGGPWQVAPGLLKSAEKALALTEVEAVRVAEHAAKVAAHKASEGTPKRAKKRAASDFKPSPGFVDAVAATLPDGAALDFILVRFFAKADDEAREAIRRALAVATMAKRYAQIIDSGQCFDRVTRKLLPEAFAVRDLQALFGADTVKTEIERLLRTHCEKFASTAFFPAREPQSVVVTPAGRSLNLARPYPVRARPGDVTPFLEHLRYLVPDDQERRILIQWLAYCVRHPEERLNWAIVVTSAAEGVGKDTLVRFLERIVGVENVSRPTSHDVEEGRLSWLHLGFIHVLNECRFGPKVTESLKTVISEDRVTVRCLHAEPAPFFHRSRLIFFSNQDAALAISAQSRRHFVIRVDAEPKPREYYAALKHWEDETECEGLAHFLLHEVDLTGFDPYRAPEPTEAHKEMSRLAVSSDAARVGRMIDEREGPFQGDLVSIEHAHAWVTMPENRLSISPPALVQILRERGAKRLARVRYEWEEYEGTQKRPRETRGNLWCLDNWEHWSADTSDGAARRRGKAVKEGKTWSDAVQATLRPAA